LDYKNTNFISIQHHLKPNLTEFFKSSSTHGSCSQRAKTRNLQTQ